MTKLEVKVKINYFHLLPTIENGRLYHGSIYEKVE